MTTFVNIFGKIWRPLSQNSFFLRKSITNVTIDTLHLYGIFNILRKSKILKRILGIFLFQFIFDGESKSNQIVKIDEKVDFYK